MVPKERNKAFSLICSKAQSSKENPKAACAESMQQTWEPVDSVSTGLAAPEVCRESLEQRAGQLGGDGRGLREGRPRAQTPWNGRNLSLFPGQSVGSGAIAEWKRPPLVST